MQSRTEQIPRSKAEEVSFDKKHIILQDMLNIGGIIDDNARGKRWNRDLIGIKADDSLTLDEPIKESMSRLKELDAISSQGKGTRWPSVTVSSMTGS